MTKVGVARLKAELSRYLEVAKNGEEVVITDRGRPVAKIVALRGTERSESRRERLAWCREAPQETAFVCLDARLRDAAGAEGFDLLPR